MPFISTKTNTLISKDAEIRIKKRYGKAISILPGKSEEWLMLDFCDNCNMYFRGEDDEKLAFVEVKIFGEASDTATNALTAELCLILQEELGISPDCVYVKYEACSKWGWNSSNF